MKQLLPFLFLNLLTPLNSQAVDIDFEQLEYVDAATSIHNSQHIDAEYSLDQATSKAISLTTFETAESRDTDSTTQTNNTGAVKLTRFGADLLNLASIDLAELIDPITANVTFTKDEELSQVSTLDGLIHNAKAFTLMINFEVVQW